MRLPGFGVKQMKGVSAPGADSHWLEKKDLVRQNWELTDLGKARVW